MVILNNDSVILYYGVYVQNHTAILTQRLYWVNEYRLIWAWSIYCIVDTCDHDIIWAQWSMIMLSSRLSDHAIVRTQWSCYKQAHPGLMIMLSGHIDLVIIRALWSCYHPGLVIMLASWFSDHAILLAQWSCFYPGSVIMLLSWLSDRAFILAQWSCFYPGIQNHYFVLSSPWINRYSNSVCCSSLLRRSLENREKIGIKFLCNLLIWKMLGSD